MRLQLRHARNITLDVDDRNTADRADEHCDAGRHQKHRRTHDKQICRQNQELRSCRRSGRPSGCKRGCCRRSTLGHDLHANSCTGSFQRHHSQSAADQYDCRVQLTQKCDDIYTDSQNCTSGVYDRQNLIFVFQQHLRKGALDFGFDRLNALGKLRVSELQLIIGLFRLDHRLVSFLVAFPQGAETFVAQSLQYQSLSARTRTCFPEALIKLVHIDAETCE